MKLNKKGTSIIELLVSVIIISLVLTFMLQLYTRIRGAYLMNSVNLEFELSKSIITDAVMKDFINYDLEEIKNQCGSTDIKKCKEFKFKIGDTTVTKRLRIVRSDKYKYYDIRYCTFASNSYTDCTTRRYKDSDIEEPTIETIEPIKNDNSDEIIKPYKIEINTVEGDDYSINLYLPTNLDIPVELDSQ